MAKCFEDEYLLVILAHGDIASNELFYHISNFKCCYQKYRKRYLKRLKEIKSNNEQNSEDWLKIYSLNKIIYFIKHKENENSGTVFEVKLLENIYIDILKFHNICEESHVTRFSKVLKDKLPGLEIRNVGKKVTAFFTSTADALISELIPDCFDFYQSLLKVVLPLRKMMASTSNTSKNSFVENFQEESTPVHLLALVSMIN